MQDHIFKFLAGVLLLIMFSCRPSVYSKMPDETSVEQLLNENPDSLAAILDEINPLTLSDEKKADYGYWITKVHIKQERSLINDTLIHYSTDYYKRIESPRLLEAYLLAAQQASWSVTGLSREEPILTEALQEAEIQKDTTAIQTIYTELGLKGLYEMPKDSAKIWNLISITKKYGMDESANAYLVLATLFNRMNIRDSVSWYVQKGIDLAHTQNDTFSEYQLMRSYAGNLNALGQSRKALDVLRDMEKRLPVGNELKFDYISTWINLGEADSTKAYIHTYQSLLEGYKIKRGYDFEVGMLDAILGMFQTVIKVKEGKPILLKDIGFEVNKIVDNSRKEIKNNTEQQYIQNKLKENNLKLNIEREKLKQRILWGSIILLAIVALLIFIYQRKLLKKEHYIRQTEEQLREHAIQLSNNQSIISKNEELINYLSTQLDTGDELKQEINTLAAENETLKKKNIVLQKDIDSYSNSVAEKNDELIAYKKLAEQNAKLQERERFLTTRLIGRTEIIDKLSKNPRYIQDSQWPEIIHAVDQIFDGFSYRLRIDYPTLTTEDIYYCCLLKLRLSTSVIGLLMGISPSSVTKRKQRIKEKMYQQSPTKILKEQPPEIYLWNY